MLDFQALLEASFGPEWFSLPEDHQATVVAKFSAAWNDPTDNGFGTGMTIDQFTTVFHDMVGTGNLMAYACSLMTS